MTHFLLQFNDGQGWRPKGTFDGDLPEAVIKIKEHHVRWPDDHLRVVITRTTETGREDFKILWWQDGADASERWV